MTRLHKFADVKTSSVILLPVPPIKIRVKSSCVNKTRRNQMPELATAVSYMTAIRTQLMIYNIYFKISSLRAYIELF